jgi:hypothetical protein
MRAEDPVAHPTLEKYRGKLVTVRVPGLRGKRTGWVIDDDDEEYDWRDDLGDAEEQVEAGDYVPLVYLGEIEDGELVEGEGFVLLEPSSQDLYFVDEGSLEEESIGSLDELVIIPLAADADEDDEDDDDYVDDEAAETDLSSAAGDGDAEGAEGEGDVEYKEDDAADDE